MKEICGFQIVPEHLCLVLSFVLAECRVVKSVNYGKMSGSLTRGSPRTVIQSGRSKSPASGKTIKQVSFFFFCPLPLKNPIC